MKVRTICTTRRAKLVIPVLWLVGFVVAIPREINMVNLIISFFVAFNLCKYLFPKSFLYDDTICLTVSIESDCLYSVKGINQFINK